MASSCRESSSEGKVKMLESSLNPDAIPFFPSYHKAIPVNNDRGDKFDKVASMESVDHEGTDALSVVKSRESDFHGLDSSFYGTTAPDADIASETYSASVSEATVENQKWDLIEKFKNIAEILSAEFPTLSMDSLSDVFFMNDGDLDETVNMLEQLEEDPDCDGDIPGTSCTGRVEP